MAYRKYDKSLDGVVLDMFGQGLSIIRIAKAFDVSAGSITKVVKNKYPDWDGRKVLPTKDIVRRYTEGETVESISNDLSVSHKTINVRLIESGVSLREQGEYQRQHFFNDDFFEIIDTERKAYWLGFMFADGNVSSRMKDVSISLKESDTNHLIKFGEDIGYKGKGIVTKIKQSLDSYSANLFYAKVSLRSSKMALDLVSKGCIPNKSLDLQPPISLPKSLERHFIRGIVDGDGYISGSGLASLEIVGAYDLLVWINERMDGNPIRPHKSIWRIRLSGKKAVEYMSYLYKDAEVYLDRKEERARCNYERP